MLSIMINNVKKYYHIYILYIIQQFKTLNTRQNLQYFTCYCNNKIAMSIHAQQGSET